MRSVKLKRTHLSFSDIWRVAWQGVTSRLQRSLLAALGIAVGVAALVALTGFSDSNRAALTQELDSMGANLLVVQGSPGPDGVIVPLPKTAVESISRQDDTLSVGGLQHVPETIHAYRNDVVPEGETNSLRVFAASPTLLTALDSSMQNGSWFDDSSRGLPAVILGAEAALRLGTPQIGDHLWIDSEWYSVIGILSPIELAEPINTAVLLGDKWVEDHFPIDPFNNGLQVGDWEQIYVQSVPGKVASLRNILADAASPGSPFVTVAALSDLGAGRDVADSMLETMGVALGSIALLVGGVGIANTMVVSVMERRGEIGLRRSLGARGSQIVTQFLAESTMLSFFGAFGGILVGTASSFVFAAIYNQPFLFPLQTAALGLFVAIMVGTLAGLQPASKAARMMPIEALQA